MPPRGGRLYRALRAGGIAAVLGLGVLLLTGCASTSSGGRTAPTATPVLTPFADASRWMLWAPLRVTVAGSDLIVPAGFVTDFASVPPALRGLVAPIGPHLVPSIVHDYLYWNQSCTRAQSDRIFLLALEEAGVGAFQRELFYQSVRTPLGARAWRDNAQDHREGRARIVPPSLAPPDASETWLAYRLRLPGRLPAARGEALPAAFCALGGPGEAEEG